MPKEGIRVEFESFRNFLDTYSDRISPTGLFVVTDQPLEAETPLGLEFSLKDGFQLLRGSGEVVWNGAMTPGGDIGMAIRFSELDDPSRQLIAKINEQVIEKGGVVFDVENQPSTAYAGSVALGAEPEAASEEALSWESFDGADDEVEAMEVVDLRTSTDDSVVLDTPSALPQVDELVSAATPLAAGLATPEPLSSTPAVDELLTSPDPVAGIEESVTADIPADVTTEASLSDEADDSGALLLDLDAEVTPLSTDDGGELPSAPAFELDPVVEEVASAPTSGLDSDFHGDLSLDLDAPVDLGSVDLDSVDLDPVDLESVALDSDDAVTVLDLDENFEADASTVAELFGDAPEEAEEAVAEKVAEKAAEIESSSLDLSSGRETQVFPIESTEAAAETETVEADSVLSEPADLFTDSVEEAIPDSPFQDQLGDAAWDAEAKLDSAADSVSELTGEAAASVTAQEAPTWGSEVFDEVAVEPASSAESTLPPVEMPEDLAADSMPPFDPSTETGRAFGPKRRSLIPLLLLGGIVVAAAAILAPRFLGGENGTNATQRTTLNESSVVTPPESPEGETRALSTADDDSETVGSVDAMETPDAGTGEVARDESVAVATDEPAETPATVADVTPEPAESTPQPESSPPATPRNAATTATSAAPSAAARSGRGIAVENVTWRETDGGTLVTVWTDTSLTSRDFETVVVGTGSPRVVVKFFGVSGRYGQKQLDAGTAEVERLRFGYHGAQAPPEIHMVADLAARGVSVVSAEARGKSLEILFGSR